MLTITLICRKKFKKRFNVDIIKREILKWRDFLWDGPYNIPRNTKGEGRILYIFSTKALIFTLVGALIGGLFYLIFDALGLTTVGLIFVVLFGIIGFSVATFKVPKIGKIKAINDISGENIDEIIKRFVKFKSKKIKKYTLYTKEEN